MPLNPQTIGELLQAREGRTFRAPDVQVDERLLAPTQRRNVLVRALRGLARAPARLSGYPVAQYPRTPAPTGEQFAEGMSDPDTADYYRELLRQAYGLQTRTPMETERRKALPYKPETLKALETLYGPEYGAIANDPEARRAIESILGRVESGQRAIQTEGTRQEGRTGLAEQKHGYTEAEIRLRASLRDKTQAVNNAFKLSLQGGKDKLTAVKEFMDMREAIVKQAPLTERMSDDFNPNEYFLTFLQSQGVPDDMLKNVVQSLAQAANRELGAVPAPQKPTVIIDKNIQKKVDENEDDKEVKRYLGIAP